MTAPARDGVVVTWAGTKEWAPQRPNKRMEAEEQTKKTCKLQFDEAYVGSMAFDSIKRLFALYWTPEEILDDLSARFH